MPYKSKSGKISGITGYEIGDDFIIVYFGRVKYKYSSKSCGVSTIETMKSKAINSVGLSTFISQNKPSYEWKS